MSDFPPCPQCKSAFAYSTGSDLLNCPECGLEWNPSEEIIDSNALIVKDANGNVLEDGDTVIFLKNFPVKNSPQPIKAGTKIKNIRLVDSDHNIDCKIDGFGAMSIKSELVRKA